MDYVKSGETETGSALNETALGNTLGIVNALNDGFDRQVFSDTRVVYFY